MRVRQLKSDPLLEFHSRDKQHLESPLVRNFLLGFSIDVTRVLVDAVGVVDRVDETSFDLSIALQPPPLSLPSN